MQRKARPISTALPLAGLALAALTLAACSGDEVTHFRVPKGAEAAPAPGAPPGMGGGMGGGMAGDVPPPPRPTEGAVKWTLPKGWTESVSGGMRYATLKVPIEGKIDVSVVVLPGPAGGELANVNRWRGQIGLAPVDEAAMAGARKVVKTKAGDVSLYDYTSEGKAKTRMVAGILVAGGNSWFLKMVGDEGPVAASRRDFLRLLESLRLD